MELFEKILGCIVGCAVGDAFGTASEQMTMEQIMKKFGGLIDHFYPPDVDRPFSCGRRAGQITDDTGQTVGIINAYLEDENGDITAEAVARALLKWADNEDDFKRFAGPTTRKAIEEFRKGTDPIEVGRNLAQEVGIGTSNGCAMKIAPAGLFNPGNLDAAIRDACMICQPTHATTLAMSGACSVAAAISNALTPTANPISVYKSALYGAEQGLIIGKRIAKVVPGSSIASRIKLSAMLALKCDTLEEICMMISQNIGCGMPVVEAVPAAIGVFVGVNGDPIKSASVCATMGNDTDTVAAISCSISGALSGIDSIPDNIYEELRKANPDINFEYLANQIFERIKK